jgi:hypothetical protein
VAVKLLETPIVEYRGIPIALEARERLFCKAISCGEGDGARGRDGSVGITSSVGLSILPRLSTFGLENMGSRSLLISGETLALRSVTISWSDLDVLDFHKLGQNIEETLLTVAVMLGTGLLMVCL